MKTWTVHQSVGSSYVISGTSLREALGESLTSLYKKECRLHLACIRAKQVLSATATYLPGILGCRGGVEIAYKTEVEFTDGTKEVFRQTVWIYADRDDLPEPVEFDGWKIYQMKE